MNENGERLRRAWKSAFDGECDAPSAALGTRLAAAFREEHGRRRTRRRTAWWRVAAALGAAALLALVPFLALRRHPATARDARPVSARVVSTPPPATPVREPAPREVRRPARHAPTRRPRQGPPAESPAEPPAVQTEFAGGFLPLVQDPEPLRRGEVIQVEMPAAALSGLGFPVNAARPAMTVRADVLLGEDGAARGIRLVSAVSNSE